MSAEKSYTLSEVVAASGAKRRSVQLWTDSGILRAEAETDRAGTGTHRKYHRSEIDLAALCAEAAKYGSGAKILHALTDRWRQRIVESLEKDFPEDIEPEEYDPLIEEYEHWEPWHTWKQAREGISQFFVALVKEGDEWDVMTVRPWQLHVGNFASEDMRSIAKYNSVIVFNITKILNTIQRSLA